MSVIVMRRLCRSKCKEIDIYIYIYSFLAVVKQGKIIHVKGTVMEVGKYCIFRNVSN